MSEDEPRTEPTTDQPAVDPARGRAGAPKVDDQVETADDAETVDKTDMNAVGDDGQVFGG
jgi:hypothetical protein